MKRNLYIVNEASPAGYYGIGTYVSQMQECFSGSRGFSVFVILLCSDADEYHYDDTTCTFHIPMGRRYSANKREPYLRGIERLFRLHLPPSDNSVFLFNFFTQSKLIDFVKDRFADCKIIFTIHCLEWTFLTRGHTALLQKSIDNRPLREKTTLEKQVYESFMNEKSLLDKVDHIICLSKYTQNLLTESYCIKLDKISTIYNGLIDEADSLTSDKKNRRKELSVSLKDKIILYAGRLSKDKGGKELIKAFQLVIKEIPNCRLILVGGGDIEKYQQESENIWTRIIYTGKISKDQVYKFYQIADIGILPSFSEQCSYVAMEMMMFGLPMIGTDSTGLSEMIEDNVTGYKVNLQETEDSVSLSEYDLAEKIIRLLKEPNIRQFRENSRRRFMENYTLEKIFHKLNTLLVKLNKTSKVCILILLLCCGFSSAFSQTIFTGKITNSKQQPLVDISVTLMLPSDSSIVSYAMSGEKGDYKISYNGKVSHLLLSISAFDIKRQFKQIENRTQTVHFTAEEGSIAIREVVVKATKAWGEKDTVNYLVSAFKDKKDLVIGDVLKKMPGIDVKESGQVTYKGKPINKFYIENIDMLQGRYGIATNNISANDISTVQVLENHQPIKALEKMRPSNDAAINLKIKEGRKGIFSMTTMLGLGIDPRLLWQEELTGMYFGKGRQHMFSYKTNNNGTDISKELRSFTGGNLIGELQMTNIQQPTPPSIRFERYNFNNTHAATTNNLFKLKNDAEVNANLIFYRNEDRRHSFARTSYLLPGDSMRVIAEDISAQKTTNKLDGEFRYNLNKERTYFNNFLGISGSWDDGFGEVNTVKRIGQRLDNKSFSANNTTHWVKRGENGKGVEVLLKNAYRTQPHHLTVTPGLYPERFNNDNDYAALTQNVRNNTFVSDNRFSFLSALAFGNVALSPSANAGLEYQTLRSDLDATDLEGISHLIVDNEMRNNITWTRVNAGLSLNAVYNIESLKITLSMPVTYRYTVIGNLLQGSKRETSGKFYFQPSLWVRYSLTSRLELNARGGLYTRTPQLSTLYTGYILQNYRSVNRYDTRLFDSNTLSSSLGLSYKDVFNLFFAGGGVSFNRYNSEGIYGQTFDGLLSVTQLMMQPNGGSSFSVNGRMSKGFDWKALVFSADASWGKSTSEQLRQEKLVDYESQWISANASVNTKPFRWLIAEYKASWGRSQGKVDTGERFSPIYSLRHQATVDVSLPFDIGLNGTFEHYYNSALQKNKNFSLADVGLNYTYKGTRFSLDWTNILNTAKYISASYGALNSYYSEYDIRPAAIMLKVRFKLL